MSLLPKLRSVHLRTSSYTFFSLFVFEETRNSQVTTTCTKRQQGPNSPFQKCACQEQVEFAPQYQVKLFCSLKELCAVIFCSIVLSDSLICWDYHFIKTSFFLFFISLIFNFEKGLFAWSQVTLIAKMAMPDLHWYPRNLNLTFFIYESSNCILKTRNGQVTFAGETANENKQFKETKILTSNSTF